MRAVPIVLFLVGSGIVPIVPGMGCVLIMPAVSLVRIVPGMVGFVCWFPGMPFVGWADKTFIWF